ncbi:hypothetical protein ACO2RV_10790 [Ancylobacter sp. VNQ12]|uniref:hypothetical protein n=1 Tax=Ancylobacter sp. VNQ12 TaxID=3400920 RepID=UPI003C01C319
MLETLFVVGFVLLPLAIAVVLILYRARFVVIGIIALIAVLMLIWSVLKATDIIGRTFDAETPARSMPGNCVDPAQGPSQNCRL